jgi:hypothetical protein
VGRSQMGTPGRGVCPGRHAVAVISVAPSFAR